MTTQNIRSKPWLHVAVDLKKDGLFFGIVGLICGFVQVVGYRYFNKANWGSELLQEHIAFNSLLLITMFLWLIRGLMVWLTVRWTMQCIKVLIEHIANRAIAFGSVAASVIIGFAISAAIFGAYAHAIKFAQAALYFVAIAEITAHLLRAGLSKGFYLAMAMVIVTPYVF